MSWLWVPKTRLRYATWEYSWMIPPRRSRRRTRTLPSEAYRQGFERCRIGQRSVRSMRVVVIDVFGQGVLGLALRARPGRPVAGQGGAPADAGPLAREQCVARGAA